MTSFTHKTAFVTGAASGIGLSITRALLNAGSNVMMSDIDSDALSKAADNLRAEINNAEGVFIDTIACDVGDMESVTQAANAAIKRFGKVHFLFNNAGVGLAGRPGNIAIKDWQWIVDINLMGIVHGIEAFIPHIVAHGEGGHVVNTASMAGHFTMAGMAPYHATKFAAVGYSETLAQELAPLNIGVSVLCPTWVKSNIHRAAFGRPSAVDRAANDAPKTATDTTAAKVFELTKGLVENGMEPDTLADLVLKSIAAKRLYIFNDPEARASIDMRRNAILADYDACLKDLGLEDLTITE